MDSLYLREIREVREVREVEGPYCAILTVVKWKVRIALFKFTGNLDGPYCPVLTNGRCILRPVEGPCCTVLTGRKVPSGRSILLYFD